MQTPDGTLRTRAVFESVNDVRMGAEPQKWPSVMLGALLVGYPIVVYFGMARLGVTLMSAILLAACLLRLLAYRSMRAQLLSGIQLKVICGAGIAFGLVGILGDSAHAILLYPVAVNAVLLFFFASSLLYPPTVVERIARLREPDLPRVAVPYLRRVTIAWTVFFICNGAIALYTALASSLATWTLYNGFIAYVLIGAMFGGELLTRMRFMRKQRK